MPRSDFGTHNLLAVSANARESALNTAQTLDTTLLVAMGDVLQLEPRREKNTGEATGYREPDRVDNLGALANGNLTFERAQPQHIAVLAAYALGDVTSTASDAAYIHTIRPLAGDLDETRSLPSFTASQRLGKTLGLTRLLGCLVDQLNLSFAKDSWLKATGTIKGTGKYDQAIVEETLTAAENAASISLAANGVAGSSAQERLEAVHRVQAQIGGVWREVEFSAASDATPAVITITAPGEGVEDISYRVLYLPATLAAWTTFPARVSESPLRVSELTMLLGGAYDGSTVVGGKDVSSLIENLEWGYMNNLAVEYAPGAGGAYASRALAGERSQTLKLTKRMRDWMLQQRLTDVEYFAARAVCVGSSIDEGHDFQVEIIWPRLAVLTAPVSLSGQRLQEAGDLAVLEDPIYGSVIVKVTNQVSAYAA